MICKHFGACGGCSLPTQTYDEQFNIKLQRESERFYPFFEGKVEGFRTREKHFRNRIELKVWHHDDESLSFAMGSAESPKKYILIDACPIANKAINLVMPKLLVALGSVPMLRHKLFAADFLATSDGEIVVSLLYHKPLDAEWEAEARAVRQKLGIDIIGRSRKIKYVIEKDYVRESVTVGKRVYRFKHIENAFTQPNDDMNEKMIAWLLEKTGRARGDLLELYCGMGNLTLPLSSNFDRVLGIEISKDSIRSAIENCEENSVDNVHFARMGAEEFTQAYNGVRTFNRLGGINLKDYRFTTVVVDPPRAGLDVESLKVVSGFDTILYISCNPETLYRDIGRLGKTHMVSDMAMFDQFAFTVHAEMGAVIKKREEEV